MRRSPDVKYRERMHRALDRAIDARAEDVSTEVLNKLKAMESSSRKIGNSAEADAFLDKVRQYEPSYQPGSHDYGTYGKSYQAKHGTQGQSQTWQSNVQNAAAEAARRQANYQKWQDFRRAYQAQRPSSRPKASAKTRTKPQPQPSASKPSASSASSSTSQKQAPKGAESASANWRAAAAKKAWETMRAKKTGNAAKV